MRGTLSKKRASYTLKNRRGKGPLPPFASVRRPVKKVFFAKELTRRRDSREAAISKRGGEESTIGL